MAPTMGEIMFWIVAGIVGWAFFFWILFNLD